MAFTLLRRGQLIPVPPPEKAIVVPRPRAAGLARRARPAGARSSAPRRRSAPASRRLAAEYGADEVIVVTITHDHEARRRSYELLAEAFGLQPRAALAATAA